MDYLLELANTYDLNKDLILKKLNVNETRSATLLPLFHTIVNSHIQIDLDMDGNVLDTSISKQSIIIPTTLDSATRTAGLSPHPLHDSVKYLASDLLDFVKSEKTSGYDLYITNFKKWMDYAESLDNPISKYLQAVYKFISSTPLISYLVSKGILHTDDSNQLLKKWTDKNVDKPDIFNVMDSDQHKLLVRFNVVDGTGTNLWDNLDIANSFVDYYTENYEDYGFCCITGKQTKVATTHPNKLRNIADKAKLISVPSDSNFYTYQGRFKNASDVFSVDLIISQKAHAALSWLISLQGDIVGGRVYLLWSNNPKIPISKASSNPFDIFKTFTDDYLTTTADTDKDVADYVRKIKVGIHDNYTGLENITLNYLVIDSTIENQGRIAVIDYKRINANEYVTNLLDFYKSTLGNFYDKGLGGYTLKSPDYYNVKNALFDKYDKENVINKFKAVYLYAVMHNTPIPSNYMTQLFNKLSNTNTYKNVSDKWRNAWLNDLEIFTAFYKKDKGIYHNMGLNTDNKNRDYLFGRLIAIASKIEDDYKYEKGESSTHQTQAEKLLTVFKNRPKTTWVNLQRKLTVYLNKLPYKNKYIKLIDDIMDDLGENFSDKPLTGDYLMGLSQQRKEFYTKKENKNTMETKGE